MSAGSMLEAVYSAYLQNAQIEKDGGNTETECSIPTFFSQQVNLLFLPIVHAEAAL